MEAVDTAVDAYVYAYPSVTMEYTRRTMTNTVAAEGTHAPMGQFVRMRQIRTPPFKTSRHPMRTLSAGMVRCIEGAMGISPPDLKGRYALFPMLSGWTDVFQVPGKRTTGTGAQKYAITGLVRHARHGET
jgi:hypothetical protein